MKIARRDIRMLPGNACMLRGNTSAFGGAVWFFDALGFFCFTQNPIRGDRRQRT